MLKMFKLLISGLVDCKFVDQTFTLPDLRTKFVTVNIALRKDGSDHVMFPPRGQRQDIGNVLGAKLGDMRLVGGT